MPNLYPGKLKLRKVMVSPGRSQPFNAPWIQVSFTGILGNSISIGILPVIDVSIYMSTLDTSYLHRIKVPSSDYLRIQWETCLANCPLFDKIQIFFSLGDSQHVPQHMDSDDECITSLGGNNSLDN
eukprot:TRINITY_DN81076_c0_g1_i1.p1 TRINITY_DN81076_c0_g1~~TRINITY_DN81076_c0_g1_i1.p1  ORF type:complete len:126 (+),score=14.70 TRINITY_DN81076_c0_g1_i1:119-496(+)